MSRLNLDFNILNSRHPVSRSAIGSNLRKLMGVIKTSFDGVTEGINNCYDARFINTAIEADLDKHGVTLGLLRQADESDLDYRARLLTAFRDIPEGLTIQQILDAVEGITGETNAIDEYYKSAMLWPAPPIPEYISIGKTISDSSVATRAEDEKVSCRFQATDNMLLSEIKAYLGSTGGDRDAYGVLYADESGAPGAKIADAKNTAVVNAEAWYAFDFLSEAIAIEKDTYYWLTIAVYGGTWHFPYSPGLTNQSAYNIDGGPPSDPFGTPTYESRSYSICAVGQKTFPDYEWQRILNDISSRFVVAVITFDDLTGNQLDDIEDAVVLKKPAHIIVRVVQERPGFYELLREIL